MGMGHEELSDRDVLEPGMVLAIEATVDDVLGSETVLVTPSGCETLTTFPHTARTERPPKADAGGRATPSGGQDRGGGATDGRSGYGRAGRCRTSPRAKLVSRFMLLPR